MMKITWLDQQYIGKPEMGFADHVQALYFPLFQNDIRYSSYNKRRILSTT